MSWLTASLLTLILWGISMFLMKLTVGFLTPLRSIVYSTVIFLFESVAILAFYGFHLEFEPQSVMLALAVGFVGMLALVLFSFSIEHGAITYVTVLSSLYPVLSTLLAIVILGEKLTMRQQAGIILGICSIVLMVTADGTKAEG